MLGVAVEPERIVEQAEDQAASACLELPACEWGGKGLSQKFNTTLNVGALPLGAKLTLRKAPLKQGLTLGLSTL